MDLDIYSIFASLELYKLSLFFSIMVGCYELSILYVFLIIDFLGYITIEMKAIWQIHSRNIFSFGC